MSGVLWNTYVGTTILKGMYVAPGPFYKGQN